MFRFIALFFVGIILYRLAATFLYNRQIKAKRSRKGRFGPPEPAEFEIIDDRPADERTLDASESESTPRDSQNQR